MAHIPRVLRQQVAERACFRCEYCQSPERITSGPMHIEHIIPTTAGGSTRLDYLAYACARCNLHKAKRTHFLDPVSNRRVALFNPRIQRWSRHFAWSLDGVLITGRTRAGRATIIALKWLDHVATG